MFNFFKKKYIESRIYRIKKRKFMGEIIYEKTPTDYYVIKKTYHSELAEGYQMPKQNITISYFYSNQHTNFFDYVPLSQEKQDVIKKRLRFVDGEYILSKKEIK